MHLSNTQVTWLSGVATAIILAMIISAIIVIYYSEGRVQRRRQAAASAPPPRAVQYGINLSNLRGSYRLRREQALERVRRRRESERMEEGYRGVQTAGGSRAAEPTYSQTHHTQSQVGLAIENPQAGLTIEHPIQSTTPALLAYQPRDAVSSMFDRYPERPRSW